MSMTPREEAGWVLMGAYRLGERERCIEKALAVEGITSEDLNAIAEGAEAAVRANRGCEFDDVRSRNKSSCEARAAREAARRLEAA